MPKNYIKNANIPSKTMFLGRQAGKNMNKLTITHYYSTTVIKKHFSVLLYSHRKGKEKTFISMHFLTLSFRRLKKSLRLLPSFPVSASCTSPVMSPSPITLSQHHSLCQLLPLTLPSLPIYLPPSPNPPSLQ